MTDYRSDQTRTTDAYLVVHFTERTGTTIRHSTVRVPLKELCHSASFVAGLERVTRRELMAHWSGVDLPDDPLF